jgi:hypothetical protein
MRRSHEVTQFPAPTGGEAGPGRDRGFGGEGRDHVVHQEQCPGFLPGQGGRPAAQRAAGAADGFLQMQECGFHLPSRGVKGRDFCCRESVELEGPPHRLLAEPGVVSAGREGVAAGELHAGEQVVEPTTLHTQLSYARAVLAEDTEAEGLFRVALDADLVRWPLTKARLELAYGSWLRRQRRVAESRQPLRSALIAFDVIGAPTWASRPAANYAPPAKPLPVTPARRCKISCRPKNCKSPGSRRKACPTSRSANVSTSRRAPSVPTCTGSSRSSTSPLEPRSPTGSLPADPRALPSADASFDLGHSTQRRSSPPTCGPFRAVG